MRIVDTNGNVSLVVSDETGAKLLKSKRYVKAEDVSDAGKPAPEKPKAKRTRRKPAEPTGSATEISTDKGEAAE